MVAGAAELVLTLQALALAADPISVRISAGANNARAGMEQSVKRLVLTDHEIAIDVVGPISVDVVHFNAGRETLTEGALRDEDVFPRFVAIRPLGSPVASRVDTANGFH